ncbi:MAG: outer membrane beta-barrel protein [Saprospiraceae bacterium]|nr:outer membrane beta-barrel protein [Saprospiraceae bacterium]
MKLAFYFLIVLWMPVKVFSQFSEIGVGLGGAVYYGDLTLDKAEDNFKLVRPNIGVFASHHFNERFAIQVGIQNFTLTADDALNTRQSVRTRNLSFRSNIWELALKGEFYLIQFDPNRNYFPFTLYAASGVSVFYHNPKANFAGQYYALRPLSTEGQGLPSTPDSKPYSLVQVAIPVIGGLKYNISQGINIFIEFGPRFTFTDYLDDVSRKYAVGSELRNIKGDIAFYLSDRRLTVDGEEKKYPDLQYRGNPKSKDIYFVGLAGLSFNFDDVLSGLFERNVKCPKF